MDCKKISIILILAFLLLVSCGWSGSPRLRAALEHEQGGPAYFEAWLEGGTGLALDGAVLVLNAPDNSRSVMRYGGDRACYESTFYSPQSGNYTLTAYTQGAAEPLELIIPFDALDSTPVFSKMEDSLGNSALSGTELEASASSFLIQANPVTGADRYRLVVSSMQGTVCSASASDPLFTVDPAGFTAGNYSAQIEAQSLSGDSLFLSEDFYAVSSASSTAVLFQVQ